MPKQLSDATHTFLEQTARGMGWAVDLNGREMKSLSKIQTQAK